MVERIKILILLFVAIPQVQAQFTDAGSYFMQTPVSINPAATGHNDVFTISWNYRNQWMGFPGAPVNQHFAFHAPMPKENVALGLLVGSENIGYSSKTSSYINYAYRVRFNDLNISFGIRGGLNTENEDQSAFAEESEDPLLFQERSDNYMIPNVGAGMIAYARNYFLGISIPEFFHYNYSAEKMDYEPSSFSYLVTAGGRIDATPFMAVEPSVMFNINSTNGFVQYYNVNLAFLKKYVVGAVQKIKHDKGYNLGSFSSLLMFKANPQTDVGLAYDFSMGDLARFSNGSLEIFLQYQFSYKIKTANPRNF